MGACALSRSPDIRGNIRDDLAELNERRSYIYDENRPDAVERRRKTGHRTARENIDDLIEGSI